MTKKRSTICADCRQEFSVIQARGKLPLRCWHCEQEYHREYLEQQRRANGSLPQPEGPMTKKKYNQRRNELIGVYRKWGLKWKGMEERTP